MKKAELFRYALNLVSDLLDISPDRILSKCRKTELVDARYLIVHILHAKGLYADEIASMMKCSPNNIRCIFTNMSYRITGNSSFRNKLQITDQYLQNKEV